MPSTGLRETWLQGLSPALTSFRLTVLDQGRGLYRDLPWRRTRDPYAIWLSEVMLQQTQVSRVDGRWQRWLKRFPTVEALAQAEPADVLDEWQGMGYNRRALSLHRSAQAIVRMGAFPQEEADLVALPGIGPATASGIRAFAFDLPGVYLETNVRSVFLHELFPEVGGVKDRELVPLVRATCPPDDADPTDDPRTWYYALLDLGAKLKRTMPNPSRRSAGHVRQSRFEGSHRQKRAELLRILLAFRSRGDGTVDLGTLTEKLSQLETGEGRNEVSRQDVDALLVELAKEGFCYKIGNNWRT